MRVLALVIASLVQTGNALLYFFSNSKTSNDSATVDSPLKLTPLINEGLLKEAVSKAYVSPFVENGTASYSGFFTVDPDHETNLFFWFFESEQNPETDPILLWLHGGPGVSALMGLFQENGPYYISEDGIHKRNYSWTSKYNVLYIDSPAGAGFSYTDSVFGYCRTVEHAARDLYEALTQFFKLFPKFSDNDFYLTGESYAGKYILALASLIHNRTAESKTKINLKGLFMGCPFIDPETQLHWGDYFYDFGIIGKKEKEQLVKLENNVKENIRLKNFMRAWYDMGLITMKMRKAGYSVPVDIRRPNFNFNSYNPSIEFIQRPEVRNALHVGSRPFQGRNKVTFFFVFDMLNTAREYFLQVLDAYRVLLYSGQYDMLIVHTQFDELISQLNWTCAKKFAQANEKRWYVHGQLAGYRKSAGNLELVLVRNANHIITKCQPEWVFDLISSFA